MLTRTRKEEIVASLKKDIEQASAIFLTNLIGIASNDSTAIRKGVRDASGKVVITRNTLISRAAVGTPAEGILKNLKGPHAVAIAFEDAPGVAKVLKTASKDHEVIEFFGGLLNGEELSVQQINALADLPSREEMLGTLLATFIAPISAFARLLNSIKDECEKQGVETPGALKMEAAAE